MKIWIGSSDDEAMEEIVVYDELSPIPITKALPQVTPEDTPSQATEFVDQDPSTGNLTLFGSSILSSLDSWSDIPCIVWKGISTEVTVA